MGIRAIVVDTAGTTTDLTFIQDVLFPYSVKALPDFLAQNQHNVKFYSSGFVKTAKRPRSKPYRG